MLTRFELSAVPRVLIRAEKYGSHFSKTPNTCSMEGECTSSPRTRWSRKLSKARTCATCSCIPWDFFKRRLKEWHDGEPVHHTGPDPMEEPDCHPAVNPLKSKTEEIKDAVEKQGQEPGGQPDYSVPHQPVCSNIRLCPGRALLLSCFQRTSKGLRHSWQTRMKACHQILIYLNANVPTGFFVFSLSSPKTVNGASRKTLKVSSAIDDAQLARAPGGKVDKYLLFITIFSILKWGPRLWQREAKSSWEVF